MAHSLMMKRKENCSRCLRLINKDENRKSLFMNTLNRRAFLRRSSVVAGAAIALSHIPKSLFAEAAVANMPIGFQSWSVKDKLATDFAGTMKTMAGEGYKLIEMCSPKGYANSGFGSLVSMKPADL